MTSAKTLSAPRMALRNAMILFVYVALFTGMLSAVYQWTNPAIEASLVEQKMKFINEVLPPDTYDNDLLSDVLRLPPTPELGTKAESTVYRARKGEQPVALVLEAVAPNGYAGEIHLVLGILANGDITGVRVVEHKETPGLGDYIDPKKDRNKKAPWIQQFVGLNYPGVPDEEWKVRKDQGRFDYRAGATVTPRAVIEAVRKAARFATHRQQSLFAEETR
jgi:electron transport complex protein RnfG